MWFCLLKHSQRASSNKEDFDQQSPTFYVITDSLKSTQMLTYNGNDSDSCYNMKQMILHFRHI